MRNADLVVPGGATRRGRETDGGPRGQIPRGPSSYLKWDGYVWNSMRPHGGQDSFMAAEKLLDIE